MKADALLCWQTKGAPLAEGPPADSEITLRERLARAEADRKAALAALQDANERYALTVSASGDGHVDWTVAGDQIRVSPRLLEILGIAAGTHFQDRADYLRQLPFHPAERERVIAAMEAHYRGTSLRTQIPFRLLVRGEVRHVVLTGICMRDGAGRLQRWAGAMADVTERQRSDAALQASEQRYALALAASGEGHWDYDFLTDEIYASPRLLEIYGFPPDAVFRGRTEFRNSLPFHPEDRPKWDRAAAAYLAGRSARLDVEMRMLPRGQLRWILITGLCLRNAAGEPVRWTGTACDITERKLAEGEQLARQEMLEMAQQAARAVPFQWFVDRQPPSTEMAPELAAMLGLAEGEFDGSCASWQRHVEPADLPRLNSALAAARRSGTIVADFRIIKPDGSVRYLQANGRVVKQDGSFRWLQGGAAAAGEKGSAPERMVGILIDNTERQLDKEELRRLEEQLRLALRLETLGTLAGGIAHDFNNILAAILGFGAMALREAAPGSRQQRDLDSIIAAGQRGRALVERILAFSRSGMAENAPVHVEAVVREALDQGLATLPPAIQVLMCLQAGDAALLGDATQVYQVVANLISNAVQAMAGDGTLAVMLRCADIDSARLATVGSLAPRPYIVLTVEDSGSGIPPAVYERMFDPFFTTKDPGVGTGLGLSLVHAIVTQLGGAIEVQCPPAGGTVFTVYFPRCGSVRRGAVAAPPPLRRGHGQRVLVVDDDEALLRLNSSILAELGYVAVGVGSATLALEAVRAAPRDYDIVLTDERMPGMGGSELLGQLRQLRPDLPVVLMSGYLGGAAVARAHADGAAAVLHKPIASAQLANSLAQALKARRRAASG